MPLARTGPLIAHSDICRLVSVPDPFFNVVDDFTREGLAIEIDLNLPATRVIRVLDRVAAWRGYPDKLRVDNGPEFIAIVLAEWAEEHGIQLEFIQPGRAMQNGFIERFNGSYRRGALDMLFSGTWGKFGSTATAGSEITTRKPSTTP